MLPSVGTRISHNGHVGTVKYVGRVDDTQGLWLGVDWDSADRGKNDGSKDGKQYFTCRYKTSGSFIRPTTHIVYGVSFLEALSAKYIETLHGSQTQETITLGSSQGAIQVEAVSLDKIREKFARLDRLREVSLENANVVKGDPVGNIHSTCPNIRGLDLSQNLFVSWETVAQITQELPLLQRLSLNRNRLQTPMNPGSLANAFLRLTEIQLNSTLMSWVDMQAITILMPKLQVVEMGYNQLIQLGSDKPLAFPNSTVLFINLDSNLLSDWVHLWTVLKEYGSLQRVVLTGNCMSNIPFPGAPSHCLSSTKYLSLSDNRISDWTAIDALSCWFPNLESLSIAGNPLVAIAPKAGNQTRPLMIARIPSLRTLDGAAISPRERSDSELFYMSAIMQEGVISDDLRAKTHYHWNDLCKKYGKPDELKVQKPQNKLGNQLMDLMLYQYGESNAKEDISYAPEATIRVLPNMTLRILRLKICKALKCDPRRTSIMFWLRMAHGDLARLDNEQESRDIDWLGLENNSHIVYRIT